jgi:pilus assembly protein CpaB
MAEKPDLNAALHKAADRKNRQAALRASLFLALALVAAVGSALLLTRYMEARTAAARVPTRPVLVAAVELAAGTEIRPDHLQVVEWPVASCPEGVFTERPALEGKVVSSRVVKGEPLLPAKLSGSGGGLSALLTPGMRAVAVRVDDVVGVAGFIHPGDTVDVIATLRHDGGTGTSSKVILQRIKVLAVGKELDHRTKANEKAVPATVATLMVDAGDSERLALAATQGKILLSLRGGADQEVVETKGVTPATLLASATHVENVPASTAKAPARQRAARREVPVKSGEVVEIMRGDLFERRDFQAGSTGAKR